MSDAGPTISPDGHRHWDGAPTRVPYRPQPATTPWRQRAVGVVTLSAVALAAFALTGCSSPDTTTATPQAGASSSATTSAPGAPSPSTTEADPAADQLRAILLAEKEGATPADLAASCAAYEADPYGFVTQSVEALTLYSDPQEPLPGPDVIRGVVIDVMVATCT